MVRTHPSPVLGCRAGGEYSRAGEGGVEGVLDEDGDPRGDGGLHGLGVDHLGAEVGQLHRLVERHLRSARNGTTARMTQVYANDGRKQEPYVGSTVLL